MTSFRPDQVSSTAHTLMSTRPSGSATSRTVSSVMSVSTFAAFFGQEIQIAASCCIFDTAARSVLVQPRASGYEEVRDVGIVDLAYALDAFRQRRQQLVVVTRRGDGKSFEPGLMPSFFASGVPE